MKTLKNKLKKQGGFTLVEMLTVVAIIAILIAISIPMVMGALDRAKAATDAANVRAAKAEMSIMYLTEKVKEKQGRVYDAEKGVLKDNVNDVTTGYGKVGDATDDVIYLMIKDEAVYYQWLAPKTAMPADTDTNWTAAMPTVN